MKKIFSIHYSDFAFNLAMFLLRAGFAFLLFFNHGLPKLQNFEKRQATFSDPLHIGHTPSLLLAIFAEVCCALFIMLGFLSRLASFVLIIFFAVIIFILHKNDPLKEKELAILFLLVFLTTLLCGPGKWSLDKLISK